MRKRLTPLVHWLDDLVFSRAHTLTVWEAPGRAHRRPPVRSRPVSSRRSVPPPLHSLHHTPTRPTRNGARAPARARAARHGGLHAGSSLACISSRSAKFRRGLFRSSRLRRARCSTRSTTRSGCQALSMPCRTGRPPSPGSRSSCPRRCSRAPQAEQRRAAVRRARGSGIQHRGRGVRGRLGVGRGRETTVAGGLKRGGMVKAANGRQGGGRTCMAAPSTRITFHCKR